MSAIASPNRKHVDAMPYRAIVSLIALLSLGSISMDAKAQVNASIAAYTYKARNLQPEDFGVDERSWEATLRWCNKKLDENPADLDTRLIRAIAYREYGVRRALVLRARDWKRSVADFEKILAQDSLFKDVLYQYATLKRYKDDLDGALLMLHRQVDLKPDTPYAVHALFRAYRQMLHEEKPEYVSAWLDTHPSGYATFFKALHLMNAGEFREADGVLTTLMEHREGVPFQPIFLARARVYYALDLPLIAQSFVRQAIQSISNEIEAGFLLEDFKYILTDEELATYFDISDAAGYSSFFNRVLISRDPIRSQEIDERMQEHYRRLFLAEKKYAYFASREAYRVMNNVRMDRMADHDFPAAYWLNGELGDKGLIYLRHGDPQDVVRSVSEGTPFIESWRYRNPNLDFHFEGMTGLSELIPTLPLDISVLEARETWGGNYARLALAVRRRDGLLGLDRSNMNKMDLMVFNNELFDESLEDVTDGLTSDRHQWSNNMQHFDVQQFLASFRGPDGNTIVELHYAIPLGIITKNLSQERERIALSIGLALEDTLWQRVESSLVERQVRTTTDQSVVAVDFSRLTVPPDSYHVSFHARIKDTPWIGAYQFDYEVPDFATYNLAISDLLPAVDIRPTEEEGVYVRNGLYVQANPGRGFRKANPMYIYFEVYNLTLGEDDQTDYEVRYTLQKHNEKKRRRLFKRSNEPVLSLTFNGKGQERTAFEYGSIDMQSVDAGVYELIVTVRDTHTDATVTASQFIELAD